MINKKQKGITLILLIAFIWMVQVSAMPLNASGTAVQSNSISGERGANHYEVIKPEAAPAKAKSLLPFVLIGVGVIALVAVLVLLKVTEKDIRGAWNVIHRFPYEEEYDWQHVFSGTKESGRVGAISMYGGSYTVDGNNVSWNLFNIEIGYLYTYTGQFDSRNTMSGTVVLLISPNAEFRGTWTATHVEQ